MYVSFRLFMNSLFNMNIIPQQELSTLLESWISWWKRWFKRIPVFFKKLSFLHIILIFFKMVIFIFSFGTCNFWHFLVTKVSKNKILNKMVCLNVQFFESFFQISQVQVKRSFWSKGTRKTVRVSQWSDLSGVQLKRMILA